MRLPWPFGRRTPSDGPSPATPDGPASSGPAPAADAPAPPTGAWATLPPIQRTVAAPPVVAPAAPFLDAMSGHQPLPPVVGQLGHDTGPDAPAGLVVARLATVPSLTSHAPMPTRPPQRRAAAADEGAAGSGTDVDWAPAPAAVASTTPIRHLPSVAPTATVTPPVRPLTQGTAPVAVAQRATGPRGTSPGAASSPRRAPAAGSSGTSGFPSTGGRPMPAPRGSAPARTVSRGSESPTSSAATPPTGLGEPLGAAPEASRAASSGEAAPAVPAASSPAAPVAGNQPHLAAGSRRAGLGAPLSSSPETAVAQRTSAGGLPLPHAAARVQASAVQASAVQGTPGRAAAVQAPAAGSSPLSSVRTPARPLPVLAVSRRRADEPPRTTPGNATVQAPAAASTPGARGSGGTAPGPTGVGTAVRPTLGARPLRAGVTIRPEPAGPAISAGEASPVLARWASGDDLPATVRSVASPAISTGDTAPVSLQRFSGPSAAQSSGSSGPAMPREIVFPPRDALVPSPAGAATSGDGASVNPMLAGIQRQPAPGATPGPLSLAPSPSVARERTTSQYGAAVEGPLTLARPQAAPVAPVVARIAGGSATSTAQSTVQASPAAGGAPGIAGVTATPVIQRVDGAAPPAPSEGGRSESELDELARALFGRIRTHLRTEVIHEREAKGLTFDAF